MYLLHDLEDLTIISINKALLLIWNLKQQILTMNNKKQPPKRSIKKL